MAITTVSSHVVSVNAIQGTLIADNAITAVHIATNAVSGTLIADNAITAVHVAQNSITVTQLADDCVESDKIADGVITTNHLNKAMISSQTEVTPVAGDFVLLGDTSDSNNLKKAPLTLLLNSNVDLSTKAPLANPTLTGSLTVEPTAATGLSYAADGTNSFINFEANSVAASVQLYAGQSSGGYFSIGTKNSSGTLAEKMRIDSSGNVCVGTVHDGAHGLTIDQGMNLSFGTGNDNESYVNFFRQASSAAAVMATGYKYTDTANKMQSSHGSSWAKSAITANYGTVRFYTDVAAANAIGTDLVPTERMRIDSSGHVGIGMTAAPVGSDTVLALYNSATPRIKLHNSTTGTASGDGAELNMSGSDFILENREAGNVRLFNNGAERMRIDSAGTIFQGTTSPTLHSAVRGIVFENGSIINDVTRGAGKSMTLAQNAAVDSGNTWAYLATDEASYYQQFNGNHYFATAPSGSAGADVTMTTRMMIHNSGCIDLGAGADRSLGTNITTTVTSGSAGSGFWMSTGNSSATSSKIISSTDGSVGDLLINQGSGVNGGAIRFSINDSEKMRIPSNGKVGINKIDGTGMLNIQSNSDYTRLIELYGSGSSSGAAALRIGISANNSQIAMIGGVSSGYAGLSYHYYYLVPQIQQSDNNGDLRLGSSSYRFHTVYSVNGTSTSDERVKEEIENLDVGLAFIKSLKPKKFKYKDKDSDGNYKDGKLEQKNGVKKWGLIAQDVKKALDDNSITEDIGLWSFEEGECNGEVIENQQQLQYQELISPLIKAIQELEARLNKAGL